jgi:hypothetical protein
VDRKDRWVDVNPATGKVGVWTDMYQFGTIDGVSGYAQSSFYARR